ncbi:MAG: hypothetical protein LUH45_07975 [Clostridiales bacterium]|nr:hypothetical protein [Clostridiales bacterium]
MYNPYIPNDNFQPVEPERTGRESSGLLNQLFSLLGGGTKKNAGGSSGIAGLLGLDRLDHGDILLVLVLIYLFRESEDDEWLIILALVLLMGLG